MYKKSIRICFFQNMPLILKQQAFLVLLWKKGRNFGIFGIGIGIGIFYVLKFSLFFILISPSMRSFIHQIPPETVMSITHTPRILMVARTARSGAPVLRNQKK